MTDTLRWLVVIETVSVAFLPLTTWLFRSLPDRGYAFAKILGLLGITWVMWWIGTVIPLANSVALLWILVVVGGSVWVFRGRETLEYLREVKSIVATQEALFIAAFLLWAIVRSLNPDINGTEKPMDLMLLQATGKASSFPPQDFWLAGFGVNYYYFGYLMMSVLGRLAGTPAVVTYNLALAFIFGSAISGTYSIAYNLCRHSAWAGLGPVFAIVLGNAHSFFVQTVHGVFPWNQYYWFWESSRVVSNTINEFPMFSFILGDLHPHLLVLPLVLLAVAGSLSVALNESWRHNTWFVVHPGRLLALGIAIGALFVTNAWDFPTYLGLLAVSLGLASYWGTQMQAARERGASRGGPVTDSSASLSPDERPTAVASTIAWVGPALLSAIVVATIAVVAFAPFYLTYHSPTGGIGLVYTPTAPWQFLQVFGLLGAVCAILLFALAWEQGFVPRIVAAARQTSSEAGATRPGRTDAALAGLLVLIVGLGIAGHQWVLLCSLALLVGVVFLVTSRLHHSRSDTFVLVLIGLSALIIIGTESVYLRDSFGGALYRMNTVFKFYFQAWLLLGLAAAYGAFRVYQLAGRSGRTLQVVWLAILGGIVLCGGSYSVLGTISYYSSASLVSVYGSGPLVSFQERGLDGMSFLAGSDRQDYRGIEWLQRHETGTPVILEATGGAYSLFGRVSTFAGLPTLLGWADHELQWRGNLSVLPLRQQTIDAIYSTSNPDTARRLLKRNHVQLVYVGTCERQIYGSVSGSSESCESRETRVPAAPNWATKFGQFMRVLYRNRKDGVVIYGWR